MGKRFGRQQKRRLVLAAKRHKAVATAYLHWNRALIREIRGHLPREEAERLIANSGHNSRKTTGQDQ